MSSSCPVIAFLHQITIGFNIAPIEDQVGKS